MDIYIIGAGNHGEVVLDIVREAGQHKVVGFLDDNPALYGQELDGVPILGPPSLADKPFVAAVGDNAARKRTSLELLAKGLPAVTVVHPTAHVSPLATLGPGTMVCAGAMVCIRAQVGAGVIINTGTVVEHHNVIGDFVHLAPRSVIAGRVSVGEGTMVGAGATVINGLTLGAWSIIGAGSVIINDVPSHTTVVGVPGRIVTPGDSGRRQSGTH